LTEEAKRCDQEAVGRHWHVGEVGEVLGQDLREDEQAPKIPVAAAP
jgi:hypothetical protein